eukprot:835071-Prorocentrum_minimum.AAC.2
MSGPRTLGLHADIKPLFSPSATGEFDSSPEISRAPKKVPEMKAVTFLALGNGAPDVFASLVAFVNGDGKIGLGAIVSAGSFVSGFVVGSVAIAAAPFEVEPMIEIKINML